MVTSLRARLTSSYILVALSGILLIGLSANFLLENQFRQYVKTNLERQNKQIVAQISQQYDGHVWNTDNIASIGMNALTQGLIVKLQNDAGAVIWDARVHNNGLCEQMMMHMAQNMLSRYPNWKGNYIEAKYPIRKDFTDIGTAIIGYYGPFYFKDTDLAFLNTLNRIFLGVTVLALLLAVLIGGFMARRLSRPIIKVVDTAREIATGNLAARSAERTNLKEIRQLNEAINNLGQNLQNQEDLRKRLTADVAHELRTPLATLQSHMEAMLDGIWKLDNQRLKVCYDEILRVNRLVSDLEKLAKYESENLHLNRSRFNLGEIIRAIAINFESEFARKGVTLEYNGADLFVEADPDKISQVLINLISNSLKFTPSGGYVAVEANSGPFGVAIIVRDTGSGIAAPDLPHIFERFYRADKSRHRSTGGAGIGLAIAKAIVEAHHGTIEAESSLGQGTTFLVRIP